MSSLSGVSTTDFQNQYNAIRKLQENVGEKITAAQNDYNDDNIFNSSDLPSANITMEEIQNMSYEEAKAVLSTESTEAVNQELSQAQETLSGLVEQFTKLQTEINNLKVIIEEKQSEYDKAVRQEEKAQNAKEEAEAEVTEAQSKISNANASYSSSVSKAQSDAYDEALKEYLSQDADEKIPEDDNEEKQEQRATSDKQSFQDILNAKLSGISISQSGIDDAQQNYANAKALQNKCQIKLTNAQTKTVEAQNNLTTAIVNYNNKETQLTNIETQLSTLENKTIPALEQKMANATFIEQNKQTIAETVFAKDPEVISAQTTVNNSNTTIANELIKANTAQTAADKAAKDGDTTKAEEEKQKAQDAKTAALKAQEEAKAAEAKIKKQKAEIEELAGVALTNPVAAQMTNIAANVGLIGTALTNATKAVATANKIATANQEAAATREAAGVSFASSTDAVTGETTKNVNKLDLTEMISAEELAVIKSNNIDLTELVDNGDGTYSPKYLIAKGQYDNQYHVYQRNGKSSELASIVRKYAKCGYGVDGGGYNIISLGNGYMHISAGSDDSNSGYSEVYYLTCNNEDYSSCSFGNTYKKYSTCSPLSLDLNGDGVKTSENIIDYDIDGDGVLDKINDSADAVLVFDADGDGISGEDGKECFGNNTDLDGDGKADGYSDGFAALKALALKHNLINNDDDMVLDEKDLKFLELSCGLKLKANGYNSETQSLSDLGVTQISFAKTDKTTMIDDFDKMGNQIMYQEGTSCTVNGKEQEVADIWHQKKQFLSLTAA